VPVTGPVSLKECPGSPNECPDEKLEAPPPPPPRPPGSFASAAEDAPASIVTTATNEKIFFMSLSLGFDRPRGVSRDQGDWLTKEMVCPHWDTPANKIGHDPLNTAGTCLRCWTNCL
jgi:hypothetical protein